MKPQWRSTEDVTLEEFIENAHEVLIMRGVGCSSIVLRGSPSLRRGHAYWNLEITTIHYVLKMNLSEMTSADARVETKAILAGLEPLNRLAVDRWKIRSERTYGPIDASKPSNERAVKRRKARR